MSLTQEMDAKIVYFVGVLSFLLGLIGKFFTLFCTCRLYQVNLSVIICRFSKSLLCWKVLYIKERYINNNQLEILFGGNQSNGSK